MIRTSNQTVLELKNNVFGKTDKLITTAPLLERGMNKKECKDICTSSIIPIREKSFFRICYEGQLRPFEVLNLQIEHWDRNQRMVTAVKVKQKWDRHHKKYLYTPPRTVKLTENTNEMLRILVGNRKKGFVFVNRSGNAMNLSWFEKRINYYAKILSVQKIKKYYEDGRTLKLITCMALREAGERHHDSDGGSRKLSAVMAGHSMKVKEQHYEKVGEDYEQIHESYEKHHPAFVEGW